MYEYEMAMACGELARRFKLAAFDDEATEDESTFKAALSSLALNSPRAPRPSIDE
jgi:hypothetical protein